MPPPRHSPASSRSRPRWRSRAAHARGTLSAADEHRAGAPPRRTAAADHPAVLPSTISRPSSFWRASCRSAATTALSRPRPASTPLQALRALKSFPSIPRTAGRRTQKAQEPRVRAPSTRRTAHSDRRSKPFDRFFEKTVSNMQEVAATADGSPLNNSDNPTAATNVGVLNGATAPATGDSGNTGQRRSSPAPMPVFSTSPAIQTGRSDPATAAMAARRPPVPAY